MKVTAAKIEDKVEIFAEIFSSRSDDVDLTACRVKFKEIEIKSLYKVDEPGSGLLTLSMDQAKVLHAELAEILCTG